MKTLIGLLAVLAAAQPLSADPATGASLMVDDFTSPEGKSRLGTYWQLFSDTVMGGISQGAAYLVPAQDSEDRYVLRMTGDVSLENNGGFIQVRLPLVLGRRPFDAGEFEGISLKVRGNGRKYYIHARTTATRLPWAYFYQGFETTDEWTMIQLPFADFEGENTRAKEIQTDSLVSLAIVAAKEEMLADIEVAEISFYR
jgi:hypothetical protein